MLVWIGAAWGLEVVDAPRWAEHVVVDGGSASWSIDQGLIFPVVDEGRPAGFVVIGPGHADVAFARPTEGWWAAARLEAPIAAEWHEPFTVAVSFGARPADTALWRLPPVDLRRGNVAYRAADGQEVVVVTGFDYGGAYGRAREAVRTRAEALARAGVDPSTLLRLEEVDPCGRWLGEVHTERAYTPLLAPAVRTHDDRWLSFAVDPCGLVDPERSEVVFVHGVAREGVSRWTTLTGGGAPARGVAIVRGVENVVLGESPSGRDAQVDVRAVLTVHRTGDGRVLPLVLPAYREEMLHGAVVTAAGYALGAVTVDGVALPRVADGWGPWRSAGDTGLYVLPPDGEKVEVGWTDRYPVTHTVNLWEWATDQYENRENAGPNDPLLDLQPVPEWVELGRRVVDQPVWPVSGPWAAPYPGELRVGTQVARWTVRGAEASTAPDGATWTTFRATSERTLTFGEGRVDFYAASGFPVVRVERDPESEKWPALVRAVLHFYADGMPRFPEPSVDIDLDVERPIIDLATPKDPEASVRAMPTEVSAGAGRIVVHGRRVIPLRGSFVPLPMKHATERGIAEALARQWFVGAAWAPRDQWIPAAIAVYLRDRFVEEAYGPREADRWRARERNLGEDDPTLPERGPLSLTMRVEPWAGEVGGRLLHDLLEPRIGERALLDGVGAFLAGPERTTAALERALSATSHSALAGFFATWIEAGLRPELAGAVSWDEEGLVLDVTADPPVGAYDVPVRISSGKVERTVWVPVRDGAGRLAVPFPGVVKQVVLDPLDALGQRRELAVR